MAFRIGLGFDIHRLVAGRKLILGGVTIEHPTGLLGHSDADALAHAVADAILGAFALGDIGSHYPDTASHTKDLDSLKMLSEICGLIPAGWRIANIDTNLIAERPKLSPYREQMQANLAKACGLTPDQVSVKFRTHEGQDAVGQQNAIAAQAVVLMEKA